MQKCRTLKNPDCRGDWEAAAEIVKALAHPTRLFFVDVLAKGERCVCELAGMVEADLSTVSKHLTILRKAGVLAHERRGSQIFYRLRTPCVQSFISCIQAARDASASRSPRSIHRNPPGSPRPSR